MNKEVERAASGIPGLDELIGGGFVRGHSILLCGSYGTGKTTFSMQFLIEGAKRGEAGLYITFEESPEQLEEEARSYGWDVDALEKANKFRVVRISPTDLLNMVEAGYGQINEMINSMGVRRVVIDSIIAFELLGKDEYDSRKYVLDFVSWLKKKRCTAIMTMDADPEKPESYKSGIAESAADGIIVLYHPKEKGHRDRKLEVLKMRETRHTDDTVDFVINDSGLSIKGKPKK